jgi:hypothetical protein
MPIVEGLVYRRTQLPCRDWGGVLCFKGKKLFYCQAHNQFGGLELLHMVLIPVSKTQTKPKSGLIFGLE